MSRFLLASILLVASVAYAQAADPVVLSRVPYSSAAPTTVHLNAVDVPLRRGTILTARYEWDFGDPGGAFNRQAGFSAAHTYDKPGTYTATLRITDESGAVSAFEHRVVVENTRRRTIFAAANGNDANDGSSQAKALRSLGRAVALAGDNTQVLLRRGDRFDLPATVALKKKNLLIGAYGASVGEVFAFTGPAILPDDRPRLVWSGPRTFATMLWLESTAADCVIQDVAFDSIFTTDTEKKGMPTGIATRSTNLTIRRCAFYNIGDGFNGSTRPRGVLMQECLAPTLTGIRSYLAWVEGSDQAYLGNIAFNSTREAILRIGNSGGKRMLVAHNTFANLDRTGVDPIDTAKNALTVQFGSQCYIAGNTLAGGPVMIGPLGDKEGLSQKDWRLREVVFEDNRVGSFLRINHGTEHLMVRNNRIWADDRAAINVEGFNVAYNRGSSDLSFAHNTARNNGSRGSFISVGGKVQKLSMINNLYIAPELQVGQGTTAAGVFLLWNQGTFGVVRGNLWPVCRPLAYTNNGLFYVAGGGFDGQNFLSLPRWNALPIVGTDLQANLSVDADLRPAAIPNNLLQPPAPGVMVDTGGARRAQLTSPGAWNAAQ